MASTLQDHYDVLIIGAGLAGIGVAWHIQDKHPTKSYAILEGRERLGGTWDFFKYPGLRSDVDMHLYGYSFKPWTRASGVASAGNILAYLNETVEEFGIDEHIHYSHTVESADWDDALALWTVTLADGRTVTARWLQMCGGYYSYESGYRPDFPGEEDFRGHILHPQDWTDDTDISGKRIVVIGSGATAVTLLPELVKTAAHVTQLQRSPTYVAAGPREPVLTRLLRKALPQPLAYRAVRKKDLWLDAQRYRITTQKPEDLKSHLRKQAFKHLPADYPYDEHFVPAYEPAEQRICFAPDGDFFEAVAKPNCEVITDQIDTFTESGMRLTSGRVLDADLIITATGLNMQMFGGFRVSVNGTQIHPRDVWLYKGVMFSGVPNFAITVGSLVHSYTLRVEMMSNWICRVLAHLDDKAMRAAMPTLPKPTEQMEALPFTTEFSSGYLLRVIDQFPKTTSQEPWVNQQAYSDSERLYAAPLEDGHLRFVSPIPANHAA